MNLLNVAKRQNDVIGVEFARDGVAFAHVQNSATQSPSLQHCGFLPCEPTEEPAEVLREHLSKLGLHRLPCNVALEQGNYQLLLGEAPKVAQDELAEALRWRIKDLIPYPVAEAVLDAFWLPEDSVRGGNRMAYAVATQRSTIAALVDKMRNAQLKLQVIDIAELALGNLAESCCDTQRGLALVKLTQNGGSLQIFHRGNLYLSRQFSLTYNAGLLDDLPADALVLELQRSLDYYERQLRQPPPGQIIICGENVTDDKITPAIRDSFAMPVTLFTPQTGVQIAADIELHTLPLCLLALGAALRQQTGAAA